MPHPGLHLRPLRADDADAAAVLAAFTAVLAETKTITRTVAAEASARPVAPLKVVSRTRITNSLRQHVIERYQQGQMSAQGVGEEFNLAKSTVLRILKEAGVDIRPQGRRLT